jgi:exodeoxyribonuclease X
MIIVIDTETTGLKEPQPCEIAYFNIESDIEYIVDLKLQDIFTEFEEMDYFCQRFKPLKPMEAGASRVNGIYDRDLIKFPCLSTFEFPQETKYIIGHNIAFDKRALNWRDSLPENHVFKNKTLISDNVKLICTKELAQLVIRGQRNNKLTTLIEYLYPAESKILLETAHSALQDCKLSFLVLLKVLEELPNVTEWSQLASLCSQGKKSYEELDKPEVEVTKMPFGKYKGHHISTIPLDYINWLLTNTTISDQGLKSALQKALNS